MLRPLLLSATALALSLSSAHAVLLDYWNFNNSNLNPAEGEATLSATYSGVGFMSTRYGTGTTLNAQLGSPAGQAVEFVDPVALFSAHQLTLSGLDFTGMSNVSLSFAFKSHAIFDVAESAEVSYRIGAGSWIPLTPIALPGNAWEVRAVSFGSLLDNLSNISIQIEHKAIFEANEVLAFDNLAVTAVPEPGSIALLGGAALVLAGVRRFARRG